MTKDNITDEKIKLFAEVIVALLSETTVECIKEGIGALNQKEEFKELEIPKFEDLSDEIKGALFLHFDMCFLFSVQRFLWENVMTEEELALKVEKAIYNIYQEVIGADPAPLIKEYMDYTTKVADGNEMQYPGFKASKILHGSDSGDLFSSTMFVINFGAFLKTLYPTVKKLWESDEDYLIKPIRRYGQVLVSIL